MDLLLYFALPVATIILSIVWQRIIKSPVLVGLTAFAIYLIVTFAAFDASFLIFAIIYTILAFIAAWIARFICENIGRNCMFRNISAENINANNIRTDTLSANEFEVNNSDDDNENNTCGCPNNRYYSYNRGYSRGHWFR